jgi:hypothetical protein
LQICDVRFQICILQSEICNRLRHAAVKHLGDVGMVHEGERLPLGLEAGQDGARIHAGLDELDGDEAFDRLGLLGHPDAAHAAFADLLDELEAAAQDQSRLVRFRVADGGRG